MVSAGCKRCKEAIDHRILYKTKITKLVAAHCYHVFSEKICKIQKFITSINVLYNIKLQLAKEIYCTAPKPKLRLTFKECQTKVLNILCTLCTKYTLCIECTRCAFCIAKYMQYD